MIQPYRSNSKMRDIQPLEYRKSIVINVHIINTDLDADINEYFFCRPLLSEK